jgi:DNA polymerase-3 subunit epsilon
VPAPIQNNIQAIHEFTNDLNYIDATQKLRVQMDGTVVFNFGKYVGESVKVVLTRERHYAGWILEKEFSSQVKQYIRQVMKEIS